MERQPPRIRIEGQDKEAKFVSEFHVVHTPNEFIVSLIDTIPQMQYKHQDVGLEPNKRKVAKLHTDHLMQMIVGRYGMSPASFKKFVNILVQNLKNYESKFGEISINPPEFLQ